MLSWYQKPIYRSQLIQYSTRLCTHEERHQCHNQSSCCCVWCLTSSGVSLNDKLIVNSTVHSSLVDVHLHFCLHRVVLIADVSRMYRAITLTESDRDLHQFAWRNSPDQSLRDYHMTRLTFGVSVSSLIANVCVRQNTLDFSLEYRLILCWWQIDRSRLSWPSSEVPPTSSSLWQGRFLTPEIRL